MSYRIAALLPEPVRRAAVAAEYTMNRHTRTDDGCCPVGVALASIGKVNAEPDSDEFAEYAVDLGFCDPDERAFAVEVADEFFADWDAGLIEDLVAALGVEP